MNNMCLTSTVTRPYNVIILEKYFNLKTLWYLHSSSISFHLFEAITRNNKLFLLDFFRLSQVFFSVVVISRQNHNQSMCQTHSFTFISKTKESEVSRHEMSKKKWNAMRMNILVELLDGRSQRCKKLNGIFRRRSKWRRIDWHSHMRMKSISWRDQFLRDLANGVMFDWSSGDFCYKGTSWSTTFRQHYQAQFDTLIRLNLCLTLLNQIYFFNIKNRQLSCHISTHTIYTYMWERHRHLSQRVGWYRCCVKWEIFKSIYLFCLQNNIQSVYKR